MWRPEGFYYGKKVKIKPDVRWEEFKMLRKVLGNAST
jgi:hypothetical protein